MFDRNTQISFAPCCLPTLPLASKPRGKAELYKNKSHRITVYPLPKLESRREWLREGADGTQRRLNGALSDCEQIQELQKEKTREESIADIHSAFSLRGSGTDLGVCFSVDPDHVFCSGGANKSSSPFNLLHKIIDFLLQPWGCDCLSFSICSIDHSSVSNLKNTKAE